MSAYKDVEKGVTDDEENLKPLLDDGAQTRNNAATKPHEAKELLPSDISTEPNGTTYAHNNHPRYRLPKLYIPETYQRSIGSPDSTMSPSTATTTQTGRQIRSKLRIGRFNTELLKAIEAKDVKKVEQLLKKGANPNATCRTTFVSACHIATLVDSDSLILLLKHGAQKHRQDQLGRTPLHYAAWYGNAKQMAVLLGLPEDIYDLVESDNKSPIKEDDHRILCEETRKLANSPCDWISNNMVLSEDWKVNIDHNCKDIMDIMPIIQHGWTPLHVASARARQQCTQLLLAAGADSNALDLKGCTPLDVAGCTHHAGEDMAIDPTQFTSVVTQLLKAGGTHNTMKLKGIRNINTPLHIAAELECSDVIRSLLNVGASISCHNEQGETPLHLCVRLQLEDPLHLLGTQGFNDMDPNAAAVDVKDVEGHTVLQSAVEAGWVAGVCVALEANADLTLKANDGETAFHSAAGMDNLDVLNEILGCETTVELLDSQNSSGETPLFKAVVKGNLECVRAILNKGASIHIKLKGNVSVFHKAVELNHIHILNELCDAAKISTEFDERSVQLILNELCTTSKGEFGPIHFSVMNNNVKCVKYLLECNVDIRLRTSHRTYNAATPLHLAASRNYVDIAVALLEHDKSIIHEVNSEGWYPLHTAAYYRSREVISELLKTGADLSGHTDGPKKSRTAIDMIINNISNPARFLEDLFDSYISTNKLNLQDNDCKVTIDYSVLMPRSCETEQMKVVEALLKTGNRYGQRRVLIHPLIESFLYLKWKALLPFFYAILAVYAIFVMSLTVYSVSVFFYKDSKEECPGWLHPEPWRYILYATIILIILQEVLYMTAKSSHYFFQLETWVKFGSLALALILPSAISVTDWTSEWPRHVATLALLLAWIEMMFLLSRFPNWGYYVLMFGKVAINVVKILLTFAFLVIGFSLSFMIQFRSQIPFDGPWAAFVKTMVMMTSEFDYQALFDKEHTEELYASIVIVRLIFIVFLVLAAIVLMNLMVGVAVNDINNLEILGNIQRLGKQVQFLGTLDILVYNKFFTKVLPKKVNNSVKRKRNVSNILPMYPGNPRLKNSKLLPSRLREAIFNKAFVQKKMSDDETLIQEFRNKLNEIHEKITKQPELKRFADKDDALKCRRRREETMKQLEVVENYNVDKYVKETKEPLEKMNVKVDQMSMEIEAIKDCLNRIESKLGHR